ncbi:MAG: AAA family ATPase [Bacteroidota bacterium]
MQRVMIIGCCGAGKSTVARRLHDLTDLPLQHLDQHYWLPNWQEPDKASWQAKVQALSDQPQWIIDGNYGGTLDIRLQRADTVIYLDYATPKCLWRITKRIWRYHGQVRPDMPAGCRERFNLNFYHYVATYNLLRRRALLERLASLDANKHVFRLRNDRAVERFLSNL